MPTDTSPLLVRSRIAETYVRRYEEKKSPLASILRSVPPITTGGLFAALDVVEPDRAGLSFINSLLSQNPSLAEQARMMVSADQGPNGLTAILADLPVRSDSHGTERVRDLKSLLLPVSNLPGSLVWAPLDNIMWPCVIRQALETTMGEVEVEPVNRAAWMSAYKHHGFSVETAVRRSALVGFVAFFCRATVGEGLEETREYLAAEESKRELDAEEEEEWDEESELIGAFDKAVGLAIQLWEASGSHRTLASLVHFSGCSLDLLEDMGIRARKAIAEAEAARTEEMLVAEFQSFCSLAGDSSTTSSQKRLKPEDQVGAT